MQIKYAIKKNRRHANIVSAFVIAIVLHLFVLAYFPSYVFSVFQKKEKDTINIEFRFHIESISSHEQVRHESIPKSKQNSLRTNISQPSHRSTSTRLSEIKTESIIESEEINTLSQKHQGNKDLDLSVPSSFYNADLFNDFRISSVKIAKNKVEINKIDISLPPETKLSRIVTEAALPDCLKQQKDGGLFALPVLLIDAAKGRCK